MQEWKLNYHQCYSPVRNSSQPDHRRNEWSQRSQRSSQSGAAGDSTNLIPVVKRSGSFEWERNSFPITYDIVYSELSQNFIMGFQAGQANSCHSAALTADSAVTHILVFYGTNHFLTINPAFQTSHLPWVPLTTSWVSATLSHSWRPFFSPVLCERPKHSRRN